MPTSRARSTAAAISCSEYVRPLTIVDLLTSGRHRTKCPGFHLRWAWRACDKRTYYTTIRDDENLWSTDPPTTNANCAIFARAPNQTDFTQVFATPCSRPANLLIGADGSLHLITFRATAAASNPSLGAIEHHVLPNARSGDYTPGPMRKVVPHAPGAPDRANIRVGAAIAPDGRIAVSFGPCCFPGVGRAVVLHLIDPESGTWTERVHRPVDHEYCYPYVAFDALGQVHTLPVMDDYNVDPGTGSIFNTDYRIERYIWDTDGATAVTVVDLSDDASVFPGRHGLVVQSDLFVAPNGDIHIVWLEYLHPTDAYTPSAVVRCVVGSDGTELGCDRREDLGNDGVNWVRLFSFAGELHALMVSWDNSWVERLSDGARVDLFLPLAAGPYPYLAVPRTGTGRGRRRYRLLLRLRRRLCQSTCAARSPGDLSTSPPTRRSCNDLPLWRLRHRRGGRLAGGGAEHDLRQS
jgi:hypothetical protein